MILERRESYEVYARLFGKNLRWTRAHYDPEQQIAVTHGELFKTGSGQREEMVALLHEFVHAMQHAYYQGEGMLAAPVWFDEGLADCRARCAGKTPDDLARLTLDPRQVTTVLGMLSSNEGRVFLNSVQDLVSIAGPGYAGVVRNAARRAGVTKIAGQLAGGALQGFYAESSVFACFLHDRHAAEMQRCVAGVMKGGSGWPAFARAFPGVDPDGLGRELVAYLRQKQSGRPASAAVAASLPASLGQTAAGVAASVTAPAPAPGFDPASLAWGPAEWRTELGIALQRARCGELDAAMACLQKLETPDADATARVARARRRLAAVAGVRDRLLAKGQFVNIHIDGHLRRGRVQRVENGTIHLLFGGRVFDVPLQELGFDDLRREKKRVEPVPAWVDSYLDLLEGADAASVRGGLGGADAGSTELRADLAGFGQLRALAEVVLAIESLAGTELPEEASDAEARFAEVVSLLNEHGQDELVASRRQGLKALARALLERAFDPASPACLRVHGTFKPLGGKRFRLRYDFDDAAGAADFEDEPGCLQALRAGLPATAKQRFEIRDGALQVHGEACARLRLPFAAPFAVRYQSSSTGEKFLVGVCDDGYRNHIHCNVGGILYVFEETEQAQVDDAAESDVRSWYVDQPYDIEIRHDGKTVRCLVNGRPRTVLKQIGTRQQGQLFIWIHDPGKLKINHLEIEATLDDRMLAAIRARWVNERMKDL